MNEDIVFIVFISTASTLPYIHRVFRDEARANEEVKAILGQVRNETFTTWIDKQWVH